MDHARNAVPMPRRHSGDNVSLRTVGTLFAGMIVMCLGITFIPTWTSSSGNPRDIVTGFFDALRAGDTEGALEYIDPGDIPTGQQAAFLDPDALRDDWTVEISGGRDSWDWEPRDYDLEIPITIGSRAGVIETTVALMDNDDGWQLDGVLADVTFPASPLTYHQANGYIPTPQARGDDPAYVEQGQTYQLFPGVYRFFDDIDDVVTVKGHGSVAVLPGNDAPDELEHEVAVAVEPMQAGQHAIEAAQEQFNALVDECANATAAIPPGCPFGTDEFIDTDDGQRVDDLSGLSWEVAKYPTISLEDDRTMDPESVSSQLLEAGFAMVTAKPGAVELSGTGTNTDGDTVDFSITCDIASHFTRALVDENGEVELDSGAAPQEDDGTGTGDTCMEESDD